MKEEILRILNLYKKQIENGSYVSLEHKSEELAGMDKLIEEFENY